MGVYERLVEDVFRNPEQRPHFIVAVNDHGAWNKDYFHTVHTGIGSITFGIVADPRDRYFEASSVADEDVPTHERVLSLDDILSPQERHDDSLSLTVQHRGRPLEPVGTRRDMEAHLALRDMKRKLVVNLVINPLTALLGCRIGDLLESAEARKIVSRVCAEAARAYAMQTQEEEGPWNDREKHVRICSGSGRVPPGLDAQALEEECLRVMRVNAGNISSM